MNTKARWWISGISLSLAGTMLSLPFMLSWLTGSTAPQALVAFSTVYCAVGLILLIDCMWILLLDTLNKPHRRAYASRHKLFLWFMWLAPVVILFTAVLMHIRIWCEIFRSVGHEIMDELRENREQLRRLFRHCCKT